MEKENNVALVNNTRRENLKFMNLPEDRREDCKGMIITPIQNDLKIDVTFIRFHAVHRVGKPAVAKTRPIIARFVCREHIITLFTDCEYDFHSALRLSKRQPSTTVLFKTILTRTITQYDLLIRGQLLRDLCVANTYAPFTSRLKHV